MATTALMAGGDMKRVHGFTLIELMMAIAVIAILAAIAAPSFREHIAKAKRADAARALLEGAQALERQSSANATYLNAAGDGLAAVYPTASPQNGGAAYTIAPVAGSFTRTTYQLKATRAAGMSNDACGDFVIDQAGVQTLAGNSSSKTVADCWRR